MFFAVFIGCSPNTARVYTGNSSRESAPQRFTVQQHNINALNEAHFGISPDGGIHFTQNENKNKKGRVKRRNKEEYEMDCSTPGKRQ
ncbi:hypothetical protein ACNKHX_16965 [Shigella flexneri]